MYCTLQEAYNIPAFDPLSGKKKKTCMSPLSQQNKPVMTKTTGQNGAQQSAQQCAISPDDLDAFNEFMRAKEYAAAKAQYTKEDFTDQPTTPYSAQGMESKFFCNNYNICPKVAINSSEHFTGQSASTTMPQQQCGSIQAPTYEIPISDAAKEEYSEAMNVSLNQENPNLPAPVPKARTYDMNKVTGYYDEDLEQYLKTNNLNLNSQQLGIPTTPTIEPSATPIPLPRPQSQSQSSPQSQPYSNNRENTDGFDSNNTVITKSNNLSKIDYIVDIILFVLIGILIILLCDQIFRIAMIYGMHETMKLLNPYLQS